MSGGKAFFDTNVLMYMYGGDAAKRAKAKELFHAHGREGSLLLSTQVVQEFYAAGSRKLGMPKRELRAAASLFLHCPLVVIQPEHIRGAIENEERYQISFWDGLVLAAAESGGAEILYTEDLNYGQRYGAVEARNPFRATFLPR